MVTVALDVMGSDHGVPEVVNGAASLSTSNRPMNVVLVGDEKQISSALSRCKHDRNYLDICHASESIEMHESPKTALDMKRDCSLLAAARLVKKGEAHALVSAGNTGAVILGTARTFQRLPYIRRAALAAVYPTEKLHGPRGDPFALMLDVGATLHVEAEDLVNFAIMGASYAGIISNNFNPKVALLSNGTEPNKGAPEVVTAHHALKDVPGMEFIGNVEGLDIPKGTADVIVCEGFLGNVSLKMLEGVFEVAGDLFNNAYRQKGDLRVGLNMLAPWLGKLRQITDWQQYGGAPILGLDKVVIKAHGRSKSKAIENALKVAAKSINKKLIDKILGGIKEVYP